MTKCYTLTIALIALALLGCSTAGTQPASPTESLPTATPPATAPPPATTTPLPPPTYEYMSETIDARATCMPSDEVWAQLRIAPLLTALSGTLTKAERERAAQRLEMYARTINSCNERFLQETLTQRGNEGWELVTFEVVPLGDEALGFEFAHRAVWKRPQQ